MAKKENLQFQTEVSQLLHLMIHSLYSNKEIFLRELISNANDACDKLRFAALSDDTLNEGDKELKIEIEFDAEKNTVTIRDNGIGMTRSEVIDNIGTIAKSGTKEFLSKLTGDDAKDSQMIGQFGVGFYSSFIVADKVTLKTRKAGKKTGVLWESTGKAEFTIEETNYEAKGTEVTLHLKDDEKEFAAEYRLKSIITKYADHLTVPIMMLETTEVESDDDKEDEKKEKATVTEWKQVNKAQAMWTLPKTEISDDDYKEFYKTVSHDWNDPLTWVHNRVEGKFEYTSLLYIPAKAPFDMWEPDAQHGLKLYVQRTFIMDDSKNLLPRYLRFIRGVIDSNDLPLNVSREILQSNKVIDSIKRASTKKVLTLLKRMANSDATKYQEFWNEFGSVMKEGIQEDFSNKEDLSKLLRFASTHNDDDKQSVSLEDYVARMNAEQENIYYITADSYNTANNSPHLEVFKKKDIEVILLHDRIDEWLVNGLTEFDGKKLQSVAKGNLDKLDTDKDKKAVEKAEKDNKDVIEKMGKILTEKVEKIKISTRLTDSAACIVLNEQDMALYMQQLMKQAGQEIPSSKPTLEINIDHAIFKKLQTEKDDDKFSDWTSLMFDQALLSEGGQLEDPSGFVKRINRLML
ncbi:MAG: molecular chaperone HtpG [Alcanivoracaceae bacterium]|nr:molecular chaperone HtpG [Alcanivoracaceae bacterium]